MKIMIAGADSYIGRELCGYLAGHQLVRTSRRGLGDMHLDFLSVPQVSMPTWGDVQAVYICGAMTRFIDCESNPLAYRINVDAPVAIAKAMPKARVVYLSSEAVERALHTAYGMHKALAEMGLRAVCNPVIARLSKVYPDNLDQVCKWLAGLAYTVSGVHHMPTEPIAERIAA